MIGTAWNTGRLSHTVITRYVEDACTPRSTNYIYPNERVAVFDMDGTLISERLPYICICLYWVSQVLDNCSYTPTEREQEVAKQLRYCMVNRCMEHFSYTYTEVDEWMYRQMAGITDDELRQKVRQWILTTPIQGAEEIVYANTLFEPMVELVEYLHAHEFQTYVITASDSIFAQEMLCDKLKITPKQVFGNLVSYHTCPTSGKHIRDARWIKYNDGAEKVKTIQQYIGKCPLIAIGNSAGDYAMLQYTLKRQPNNRKGLALCVLCDDTQRDYGDLTQASNIAHYCAENEIIPISTQKDWLTLWNR